MAPLRSRAVIAGVPAPKARPRFARGRAYTPRASHNAEEAAALQLQAQLDQLGPARVEVTIDLFFSSRARGDIDNCAKLVLDALVKARIIDDDRQIDDLWVKVGEAEKGEEHTVVSLAQLPRFRA